jgi:hypothetical protein
MTTFCNDIHRHIYKQVLGIEDNSDAYLQNIPYKAVLVLVA